MMNRNTIGSLAVSAAVMLGLPWITVTFVNSDSAMAVCFLLFFAVNPICSIMTGLFAGKDRAGRWYLPIAAAALFLLGVWAFFDMGEPAFLTYAAVYLCLGVGAMFLAEIVGKKRRASF